MGRGRPRKPSALRELEGNRSRRDIPPDLPLPGIPECPDRLTGKAREHFNFVAAELMAIGVTKRLDTEGLAVMGALWSLMWDCFEAKDIDGATKLVAKWSALAGKYGMMPSDRAKLMAAIGTPEKPDETEERYFKVTG
jgi:phage terminase small subunit